MVPGGLRTMARLRLVYHADTDHWNETPAPQSSRRAPRSQDETLDDDQELNGDFYSAAHGGGPTATMA